MLCINRRAHQTGRLAARKLTKLYNKHSPANHVQMVTKGGTKWQAGESGEQERGEETLWYLLGDSPLYLLLIRNSTTWLSSQRDQSRLVKLQKFYCQKTCLKISQICYSHGIFFCILSFFFFLKWYSLRAKLRSSRHSWDGKRWKLKRRGCEEGDFKLVLHLRGLGWLVTTSCWHRASGSCAALVRAQSQKCPYLSGPTSSAWWGKTALFRE